MPGFFVTRYNNNKTITLVCRGCVMKRKEKILDALILLGFIFYMVFLLWNIVFKYVSPFELFSKQRYFSRTLNLIPFNDILHGNFNKLDIFGNIILFIPLGVYLNLSEKHSKLYIKILKIGMLSLIFEAIQFIFAIGASDITDVITNSLGGIIGVGIYYVLKLLVKKPIRIKMFISIVSTLMVGVVSIILVAIMTYN